MTTKCSCDKLNAVGEIGDVIVVENEAKSQDAGYQWQAVPGVDKHTALCLASARMGELWPGWLPRVGGHPLDPDYPYDRSPPHGMNAFHIFDLYCQILVQVLMAANPPIPLEFIYNFQQPTNLDSFSGRLVAFRERAHGKGLKPPSLWEKYPTSSVKFIKKMGDKSFRTIMSLRNMYVFSDTAVINLKDKRVCGIGIIGSVEPAPENPNEIQITIIPLIIGMGGLGRSDSLGWIWEDAP